MSTPNTTTPMPRHPFFNAIVAKNFFENYCPEIRNWKHKLRGVDGNGSPIDFSKDDKKYLSRGFKKLVKDLEKMDIVRAT